MQVNADLVYSDLTHPESLAMGDAKHGPAIRTEIDVPSAQNTPQFVEENLYKICFTMRTLRQHVKFFFKIDHDVPLVKFRLNDVMIHM